MNTSHQLFGYWSASLSYWGGSTLTLTLTHVSPWRTPFLPFTPKKYLTPPSCYLTIKAFDKDSCSLVINYLYCLLHLLTSMEIMNKIEEEERIKIIYGNILDSQFSSKDNIIVHIINCIAIKPHGLSNSLAIRYPYSNVYAKRKGIKRLNRATVDNRPKPGTLVVSQNNNDKQLPYIGALVSQFYMGKSSERNFMTKKLIKQLKDNNRYNDESFLKGLINDTQRQRVIWFKESLIALADHVNQNNIKRIIFPYRIGCGLAGGNWSLDYYPAILQFSDLISKKIEILIVKPINIKQ